MASPGSHQAAPRARALIDLRALRHNLARVRALALRSRVMAVIKANGYGHGLERMARGLGQPPAGRKGASPAPVDAFAVACMEEAVALRDLGIAQPIVLLEGVLDAGELQLAVELDLQVVVHHPEQLGMLERASLARPVETWVKIDTGMHRLGFAPEQVPDVRRRLEGCREAARLVGWMTHLGYADDRRSERTPEQLALFRQVVGGQEAPRSAANSGGVLGWPESHFQWVRPGIMLYGASPFVGRTAQQEDLQPVMTLTTRLIAVNRLRKGDAVGYGGTWVCPEDMPVGIAAIGYGDGYPRHAPSGTPVLVNGRSVPLVGVVSMDMLCVDLRQDPGARIGDPVTLWGDGLPVEEVARHAGTIPYQLLCAVTSRVEFVSVDDPALVATAAGAGPAAPGPSR